MKFQFWTSYENEILMYKIRYGEQTLLHTEGCNCFYDIEESGNEHFQNIVLTSFFITLVI